MPAVTSGKVLVTGANGYIAVWLVQRLLEKGYSVRGTSRSESKGVHLKETFKKYGDRFEFVVVEDITKVRRLHYASMYYGTDVFDRETHSTKRSRASTR